MADENKKAPADNKRKKMVIGLLVVIVAFLVWQMSSLFGGGGSAPEESKIQEADNKSNNMSDEPKKPVIHQVQVAKPLPMSQRERELLKIQQETQAKYVEALNQLQMLKLSLQIAETNKSIMAAKFETIKNQKDIVDLLTPPKTEPVTPDFRQSFTNQMPTQAPTPTPAPLQLTAPKEEVPQSELSVKQVDQMPVAQPSQQIPQIPYTVVSVTKLQDKWSAVIGVQGSLFEVHIGDVIPVDGSKVKSISNSGIVLERDGKERKVSLIPII